MPAAESEAGLEARLVAARKAADAGELEVAITELGRIAADAFEGGFPRVAARSSSFLGEIEARRGNYSAAVDGYLRCQNTAEELGDSALAATAARGLGSVHLMRADYSMATECFEQFREHAERSGDKALLAAAWVDLGNVHYEQWDHESARVLYRKALQITAGTAAHEVRGRALHNLGETFLRDGRLADAEEHLQSAIEAWRAGHITGLLPWSLFAAAEVAARQGNVQAAFEMLREAGRSLEAGDRISQCSYLSTVAIVERQARQYTAAEAHFQEALALANELGHPREAASIEEEWGLLCRDYGDVTSAWERVRRAADRYRKLGLIRLQARAEAFLTDLARRGAVGPRSGPGS